MTISFSSEIQLPSVLKYSMEDVMTNLKCSLNRITSRMVLVFPPETIHEGQCFCRFEPDGIALLKGFLKERGYSFVDLVYAPVAPETTMEMMCPDKSKGWGISPFDEEGISFRNMMHSALNLSLNSSTAKLLMNLLPLSTLINTSIIGFSIGFSSQLYHSLILSRIVKQLNPNIFVVFGGPLITATINFVVELQELSCHVDGIIAGYGEEPLAQLLLCLENKGELKNVPNLYLPTAEGFRLNVATWKPDKTNLLTIPDYGRATLAREFDPCFPVRPSIGCYWGKCAFCVYPSMSTGTSKKRQSVILTPEELVEYIKSLMKNGSGNNFELCCDSLPPLYLKKFSEQVLMSNLKIKWTAWACVDKRFTDAGILDTMKSAGCESILLGVESACQRTLERMNKMQTRQDIDHVLTAFFSSGIGLFVTLFIGFPGETREEAMQTIEFIQRILNDRVISTCIEMRLYRFVLMCNTPIVEHISDYNISSVDWSDVYHLEDVFGYHYEVAEGMGFTEVESFVLEWRSQLGIKTDDSYLNLGAVLDN